MKKLVLLLAIVFAISLTSCTENTRAKNFGGNASMDLPSGQKLVIVTWKDDNLWVLTKPMTEKDVAETYTFQEESSFGILEGTYIITEKK
jgi:uncharacterized lipoprotein YehR (DUF1307 family)